MAVKRRITDEQEAEILRFWKQNGHSRKLTREKFGIKRSEVDYCIVKAGGAGGRLIGAADKLTEEAKADIARLYQEGERTEVIGEKYGLNRHAVYGLASRLGVKRLKKQKVEKKKTVTQKVPQLCWECAKATGGCNWSRSLEPVEGWTAETVVRCLHNGEREMGWLIKACPEFERG